METQKQRTAQEVRDDLSRKGISIRKWALQHGFSPVTVHQVLKGENSCAIGMGHRIAVTLNIKQGEIDAS